MKMEMEKNKLAISLKAKHSKDCSETLDSVAPHISGKWQVHVRVCVCVAIC